MLGECFDPDGELLISEHCRPHWSQAGAMVFIMLSAIQRVRKKSTDALSRSERRHWKTLARGANDFGLTPAHATRETLAVCLVATLTSDRETEPNAMKARQKNRSRDRC